MSSSIDHDDKQQFDVYESSEERVGDWDSDDNLPGRPGQAERKRELERNRRNLINTRFAELNKQLQRTERHDSDYDNDDSPKAKRPRMDKEALLKEATMRLVVQSKELSSVSARLKDLLAQIDAMRVEMADLRKDKSFLRIELDSARLNNSNLWASMNQNLLAKSTISNGDGHIVAASTLSSSSDDGDNSVDREKENDIDDELLSLQNSTVLPDILFPPETVDEKEESQKMFIQNDLFPDDPLCLQGIALPTSSSRFLSSQSVPSCRVKSLTTGAMLYSALDEFGMYATSETMQISNVQSNGVADVANNANATGTVTISSANSMTPYF